MAVEVHVMGSMPFTQGQCTRQGPSPCNPITERSACKNFIGIVETKWCNLRVQILVGPIVKNLRQIVDVDAVGVVRPSRWSRFS